MKDWHQSSVLSTSGWTTDKIIPLLDLAQTYKTRIEEKKSTEIGTQRTCMSLFFEPSTRTRLSFESAANRLGIRILTVEDAGRNSSSLKGESLEDTGRILSAYADVIVVRHPESGSAEKLSTHATVPIINAGDGSREHPTQALVDLFSIREIFKKLDGLHVGFCGDLKNGRTVHSLLRLLVLFGCKITAISPKELELSQSILDDIPGASERVRFEPNLNKALANLDVLYMTRIQKERFDSSDLYERIRKSYCLTRRDLEHSPEHLKVLHPLPRLDEISPEVDRDKRAYYFTQAANGVPVRMALLTAVLGL